MAIPSLLISGIRHLLLFLLTDPAFFSFCFRLRFMIHRFFLSLLQTESSTLLQAPDREVRVPARSHISSALPAHLCDILPAYLFLFSHKKSHTPFLLKYDLFFSFYSRCSLFRNDDRCDDVRKDSGSSHKGKDHPCQSHQRRIDVKIFSDSAADSTDHIIG